MRWTPSRESVIPVQCGRVNSPNVRCSDPLVVGFSLDADSAKLVPLAVVSLARR